MRPPDAGRRFRLFVKLWPDAALPPGSLAREDRIAFDASTTLTVHGDPAVAAAVALDRIAALLGQPVTPMPGAQEGHHADDSRIALAEAAGDGVPWSLWRGKDGWIVVHTASYDAWRTFCGTFLNRTAWRSVAAADAWRGPDINALATTVLDTHPVDDAVGTCLTYGVAAAAVDGWRDRETGGASRTLADMLAWAALIETGEGT